MTSTNTISYALTCGPTPVFNIPDLSYCFGGVSGDDLPLDEQGLMRSVETILFPNTKVKLLEQIGNSHIWKISADEYPYKGDFFIDERFIQITLDEPYERSICLPTISDIIQKMKEMENASYIWGANWPVGIDLLPALYPSRSDFSTLKSQVQDTWKLRGVDCSGLLYYATMGFTPRNTSSLIKFGYPVAIEGKEIPDILKLLQKLDIIVWKGHVVCIIDKETTIESKLGKGVFKCSAIHRLTQIMQERNPANTWDCSGKPCFLIRRWHPESLSH
jgi:hypothetical protein